MFKKLIEKFLENQECYQNLKIDVEYLTELIKRKTEEINKHLDTIKELEKKLKLISKLLKDLDSKNKIVKEIKKILKQQ